MRKVSRQTEHPKCWRPAFQLEAQHPNLGVEHSSSWRCHWHKGPFEVREQSPLCRDGDLSCLEEHGEQASVTTHGIEEFNRLDISMFGGVDYRVQGKRGGSRQSRIKAQGEGGADSASEVESRGGRSASKSVTRKGRG